MIEISNRDYSTITTKLPGVLAMAKACNPTLRQSEDIRQLSLMVKKLTRKSLAANR